MENGQKAEGGVSKAEINGICDTCGTTEFDYDEYYDKHICKQCGTVKGGTNQHFSSEAKSAVKSGPSFKLMVFLTIIVMLFFPLATWPAGIPVWAIIIGVVGMSIPILAVSYILPKIVAWLFRFVYGKPYPTSVLIVVSWLLWLLTVFVWITVFTK